MLKRWRALGLELSDKHQFPLLVAASRYVFWSGAARRPALAQKVCAKVLELRATPGLATLLFN